MLQHKLNQAKNARFQLKKKKICTLSNVSFLPCLAIPKLHDVHTDALVHVLLTLEHSDKQISLWLVWSFRVCTFTHLKQQKQKHALKITLMA